MSLVQKLDQAFDLFDAGELASAAGLCREILSEDANVYGALYLLGSILAEQGSLLEAKNLLQRAVALQPERKIAYFNLAKVLLDLGDFAASLVCLETYLGIDEFDPQAHVMHATALAGLRRFKDSHHALDRALALNSRLAEAWYNRGNLFKAEGFFDAAIDAFKRAIEFDPASVESYINCGVALNSIESFSLALEFYSKALSLDPGSANAWSNRGITLHALERFSEAQDSFDRALSLNPDHPEARSNRAYTKLLTGNFLSGWQDYEYRRHSRDYVDIALGAHAVPMDRIIQSPIINQVIVQHVVLMGEQGVGDIIMFSSMIDDLLAVAARVDLVVEARLCRLLQDSFPAVRVMDRAKVSPMEIGSEAIWLFIGSLGSLFRPHLQSFPRKPYLRSDAQKVLKWKERIGPTRGRCIGMSWAGGLAHTRAGARSLTIHDFNKIFSPFDELTLINLQHGASADEIVQLNDNDALDVRCFPPEDLTDLSELAALISALDGVVTVQNTNVHLSGALGQHCLAILPYVPEWRYALSGSSMPWYGSVELFRRSSDGAFAPLLPELQARLNAILKSRA